MEARVDCDYAYNHYSLYIHKVSLEIALYRCAKNPSVFCSTVQYFAYFEVIFVPLSKEFVTFLFNGAVGDRCTVSLRSWTVIPAALKNVYDRHHEITRGCTITLRSMHCLFTQLEIDALSLYEVCSYTPK